MKRRTVKQINEKNSDVANFINMVNTIICISCWIEIGLVVMYFATTLNWRISLLLLQYTPIRYFFFDIAPQKIQKRPPSLDRSIPLTIFVRYLSKRFPVPQGNILADIFGLFLAMARASVNGYALLWFDTFTFFFSDHEASEDVLEAKSDDRIKILMEAFGNNSEDNDQNLKSIEEEWRKTRLATELDQWNFPIRRYLSHRDDRFKAQEFKEVLEKEANNRKITD